MKMQREQKVDKRTAIELVTSKIKVMGQSAILPQFSRIETRIKKRWGVK